jgi:hypothetical protein
MRSLSPTSPMLGLDSSPLSTSPSSASRCPHCKIHSWLPHSAGCPNKKNWNLRWLAKIQFLLKCLSIL